MDKTILALKYHTDMKDSPLYDLSRQANIDTNNQLMALSDYSWQDCLENVRSTGEYMIFYQGGTIEHCTHVPVSVDQSSSESQYNAACTTGLALGKHFYW